MGSGSSRRWRAARRQSPGKEEGEGRQEAEPVPESLPKASPARIFCPPAPDPDLALLEKVLEECGSVEEEQERLSHIPASLLLRLDAGDASCHRLPRGAPEAKEEPRVSPARSIPESSDFTNQVPLKNPDRPTKIAYDYSEEELMATIEQEYFR
ncbi:cystin-1 [Anolis carolinensis]|uniref:cystin-1 n=1 Tax=Anolis carolinensis TaxID=28377 RepID=UPI000462E486|nr:PREDICTED: cystin-1 [Anolis carolinensis]|eukprot:XP_008115771.1 PREDICTED: cystin-1 [Anolis carolinensis]